MKYKRSPVYIAALGIVSPLGTGTDATLAALKQGSSAIAPLTLFPVQQQPPLPVGQVEGFTDTQSLPRTHRLAIAAAQQAMADHDCNLNGVYVGTTTGGIERTEQLLAEAKNDPVDYIGSYSYHGLGTVAEEIGRKLGCREKLLTFSTACSSGAVAISMACRMLQRGQAQWLLAGGADSLSFLTYYGFHSLQLVDEQGCRPFDLSRAGMTVAEGAAFLLLTNQKPEHSYGVILGSALSCDAHHGAAPHPEGKGARGAMEKAMADSGVAVDTVDYINMHGTGTPDNDLAESKAVRSLFPSIPPLSSIKGMTGHGLAASGAIEAVLSALCLQYNILPANIGCETPDPECELEPLTATRSRPVSTVLSNSFGFGGNNACLLIADSENEKPVTAEDNAPLSIVGKSCITGAGHTLDSLGNFFLLQSMAGTLDSSTMAEQLPLRSIRRLGRFARMGLALAAAAKNDADIEQSPHAVFMGSGWGALSETWDFLEKLRSTGEQFPSPIDFVGSVHNSAAGQIAIRHGATGSNVSCSGGDSSFEQALLATEAFLGTETRYNTAFVLGADEFHPHFTPLLDPSAMAEQPADGGGGFYICRKAIPGKVAIRSCFYEQTSETVLEHLIGALGSRETIRTQYAMILAGIPAAFAEEGEQQLDLFMRETKLDVPVIHYRKFTGEFAAASAVAAVMAAQLIESGEVPNGKGILVLGFGKMCTAMELIMQ